MLGNYNSVLNIVSPNPFIFECRKRGGFVEERKEHEKWIIAKEHITLDCVRATLKLRERIEIDVNILDKVYVFEIRLT